MPRSQYGAYDDGFEPLVRGSSAHNLLATRSAWKQAAKSKLSTSSGRPRVSRANTLDVESGNAMTGGAGGDGPDSPLEHSNTAPEQGSRSRYTPKALVTGLMPVGATKDRKRVPSPIQEHANEKTTGSADPLPAQNSSTFSSDTTAADSGNGDLAALRKRPSAKPATGEDGGDDDGPGDLPIGQTETARTDKKLKQQASYGFFTPLQPSEPFTFRNQIARTLFKSWLNILILAAPAGIAIGAAGLDGRIVFAVNFVAIIPLAAMLSDATEEVALRTGEAVGGLINATFGNAVEVIVAIIALAKNEVPIVQTSLIGSILSNLLLVLGMCFFAGGYSRREQHFNTTVVDTAASLLILAIAGLIVPTVFQANPNFADPVGTAALSRGVAVILFLVYVAFLVFQLHTHSRDFAKESQKVDKEQLWRRKKKTDDDQPASTDGDFDDDGPPEPELSFVVALVTLAAATAVIAVCAEYMVDGISAITDTGGVSEEFVGLILLPIVGNAAEHVTAVKVAIKDKMDLSIGVAVGSSIQVALFVIPLVVIIGWGMGKEEMTLAFDEFQVAVMFVSVLLVNYLIGDGKSNWLEGVMLMSLYIAIAVCSWWYPILPADTS